MLYDVANKYVAGFLRDVTIPDLRELLDGAQQKLYELRQQCSLGGRRYDTKKPHLFSKIKKDIARIKTILKEVKCQLQQRYSN